MLRPSLPGRVVLKRPRFPTRNSVPCLSELYFRLDLRTSQSTRPAARNRKSSEMQPSAYHSC
jgi:hypothetical protein